MGLLNTGLNALGTYAAVKSLTGGSSGGAAGKLNSFISELRSSSVARTNLFDVTFGIPAILAKTPTAQKLSLYAEAAQLPGMNIQTDSIKRFGIGPTESTPYTIQNNDITITFIGDGKGEVYKFFYNWMHGIVNGDNHIPAGTLNKSGLAPYEVEFKDRYQSTITITSYNETGQPVLVYNLYDAFPKTMPDISLNWNEGSTYMQFGVTFSFLRAKLENANQSMQMGKNGIGDLSAVQKAVKIGTALQVLSALKKPSGVQDALSAASSIKNVGTSLFR